MVVAALSHRSGTCADAVTIYNAADSKRMRTRLHTDHPSVTNSIHDLGFNSTAITLTINGLIDCFHPIADTDSSTLRSQHIFADCMPTTCQTHSNLTGCFAVHPSPAKKRPQCALISAGREDRRRAWTNAELAVNGSHIVVVCKFLEVVVDQHSLGA